jgi:hypothetical protein
MRQLRALARWPEIDMADPGESLMDGMTEHQLIELLMLRRGRRNGRRTD